MEDREHDKNRKHQEHRFYRTGQLADKGSVSVRALRYYDRMGLLPPSHHTQSGCRLYTDDDWLLLQQILALKFLGFSLEQVKHCLSLDPTRLQETLLEQKALLQEQQSQLNVRLQAIEKLQARLKDGPWEAHSLLTIVPVQNKMTQKTTLSAALKLLEAQLIQDKRPQFVSLLEKHSVQEAIQTAQAAYEPSPPGADYYQFVIAPLLQQIVEQGAWPEQAGFAAFYELPQNGVTYQGLGVSLEIETPDHLFKGFSLPILDIWYGRWVE